MPDHWQETTLGDVADWFAGGTPKATNPAFYDDGQIPWAVIADLLNDPVVNTAKQINEDGLEAIGGRLAPAGSILVSMYGTIARTALAGVALATNQAIAWAEPYEDSCNGTFLRLLVDREQPAFESAARGAAQKNINRGMIKSAAICLPPLEEQRRIVDLVGSIDTYIDSLKSQIDATRTARAALLSELLSNPGDDWHETTLGEFCGLEIGRTPPRKEAHYWTDSGERPFCTIADMDSKVVFQGREGVTELAEMNQKARRIPAGSLLMSFKLTIGRVAFAGRDLFPNEAIVAISPDESRASREFLYLNLGSRDLTEGSGQAVKGKTLNSTSLRQIAVHLPPLEEQRRIVDLVGLLDEQISSLESQVESVRAFRSGVLSELLSGERLLDESYDVAVGL